jgi:hypothetical protein
MRQVASVNIATIATQNDRVNPPRFRRGGFDGVKHGFQAVSRHIRLSSLCVTFTLPAATLSVRI